MLAITYFHLLSEISLPVYWEGNLKGNVKKRVYLCYQLKLNSPDGKTSPCDLSPVVKKGLTATRQADLISLSYYVNFGCAT